MSLCCVYSLLLHTDPFVMCKDVLYMVHTPVDTKQCNAETVIFYYNITEWGIRPPYFCGFLAISQQAIDCEIDPIDFYGVFCLRWLLCLLEHMNVK